MPEKKKKSRRKQADVMKVAREKKGKGAKMPKSPATSIVLSLPAQMSQAKLAVSKKAMAEVWQDVAEKEAAHAESIKAPKAEIKMLEEEVRRAAKKGGLVAGEKIAGLREQLAEATAKLGHLVRQFAADKAGLIARSDKLQSVIQSGTEYSPVECSVTRNYENKTITTTRTDTGKVIEERAMEPDELQLELAEVSGSEGDAEGSQEAE
jgi:hypothetical protein